MIQIEVVGVVDKGFPLCELMISARIDGELVQLFVPYEDTDFMPDPWNTSGEYRKSRISELH